MIQLPLKNTTTLEPGIQQMNLSPLREKITDLTYIVCAILL